MKYHDLTVNAHQSRKRVGRGISAGGGKTAGRGTKGQNSRTGGGVRPGFEGGQNPLMQRLPKLRGFTSHRTKPEVVYTGQLQAFANKTVTNHSLAEAGLVSSPYASVKVVLKGDLSAKVSVSLQKASKQAIDAIKKAGGSFTVVERQARPKTVNKADKAKKTTK